jgi:hypothetical protein
MRIRSPQSKQKVAGWLLRRQASSLRTGHLHGSITGNRSSPLRPGNRRADSSDKTTRRAALTGNGPTYVSQDSLLALADLIGRLRSVISHWVWPLVVF